VFVIRRWCLVPAVLLCATCAAAGGADEAGVQFFESRVRPLLAEHCYRCHSADAEEVKAGLRVDSREGLIAGGDGGPALVPGRPGQSRLIEAVRYASPELQMPPRRRLSDEQVADLVRWVELGAPWPGGGRPSAAPAGRPDMERRRATHWAWQPVRATAPPAVEDQGWVRTRVDRFILARLEAAGLRPAPPADRRSLLRRVHFALVGLPPTPEEVEDFVADPAPDALERAVDRLLASPRFGERWARHWMDLARYSDTLGNEADKPIPNAWRYRDYLVRAFNADLPYDRLILEHLAGDLLDDPRRRPDGGDNESVLGTASSWMGEGKRSPVDLRQARADAFDNRIDAMARPSWA
jgi:mono/diheme cytochrome c family protein